MPGLNLRCVRAKLVLEPGIQQSSPLPPGHKNFPTRGSTPDCPKRPSMSRPRGRILGFEHPRDKWRAWRPGDATSPPKVSRLLLIQALEPARLFAPDRPARGSTPRVSGPRSDV